MRNQATQPPDRDNRALLLRIIVTIIVSIIIPILIAFVQGKDGTSLLTAFEQFEVGVYIFFAITLTSITFELGRLVRFRAREYTAQQIEDALDERLATIRSAYKTLLDDGPSHAENLFTQYFEGVIMKVSDDISHSATKKELRVSELTYGTTNVLMDLISRNGPHDLQLVHLLDTRPNNFDCSTWARSYYSDLTRLARDKKVHVKRLFIYGTQDDLTDGVAKLLFEFHSLASNHECRTLSRRDWDHLVKGYGLTEVQNEIGIWGKSLAYLAIRSTKVDMYGTYTSSPSLIHQLEELFAAGWKLAIRPQVPTTARSMSVDKLFDQAAAMQSLNPPPAPVVPPAISPGSQPVPPP